MISKQWYVKMESLSKASYRSWLKMGKQNLFLNDLIKFIITGWKIFKIGVFQDSFGGDIEFQYGIAKIVGK